MKGHVNTKNGEISIENQVIAKYAGICALGCFGIVGMAMVNMKDRLPYYCILWSFYFYSGK